MRYLVWIVRDAILGRQTRKETAMRLSKLLIILCSPLIVAACGDSQKPNSPRPPTPATTPGALPEAAQGRTGQESPGSTGGEKDKGSTGSSAGPESRSEGPSTGAVEKQSGGQHGSPQTGGAYSATPAQQPEEKKQ
jgi:hypothetical protein